MVVAANARPLVSQHVRPLVQLVIRPARTRDNESIGIIYVRERTAVIAVLSPPLYMFPYDDADMSVIPYAGAYRRTDILE